MRAEAGIDVGVVGFLRRWDDSAHRGEVAVAYVCQNLRRVVGHHVIGPHRTGAGRHTLDAMGLADVAYGIRRGPDRAGHRRVIPPGELRLGGTDQVGQRAMLETRRDGDMLCL